MIFTINKNNEVIYATQKEALLKDFIDKYLSEHLEKPEQALNTIQKIYDNYIMGINRFGFTSRINSALLYYLEQKKYIFVKEEDVSEVLAKAKKLIASIVCDGLIGSVKKPYDNDATYNEKILNHLDDIAYTLSERITDQPFLKEDVEEITENL